jgi:hypothetical protein
MRFYTSTVMARRFAPGDRMTFSNGRVAMTAETADHFARDLVELDRETGLYRRLQSDPGSETAIINEAKFRQELLKPIQDARNGNRIER